MFGLDRSYYFKALNDIDSIVRNGNGGYTFTEVYSFPIWLRRYVLKQIEDDIRERNKQMEKNSEQAKKWDRQDLKSLKDKMSKDNPMPRPPVSKPYVTSAGKK